MKRFALLAGAAAVAFVSASASAYAASAATSAFVANVRPNVDFLDRSSRMALDKTLNPVVRSYAHSQAMEQTVAANSLVAWTQTNTVAGQADALGSTIVPPLAPIGGIVTAPLDIAAGVTGDVDRLATGRSVAIDRPLTVPSTATGGNALLPAGADDLDRLGGLSGRRFDALYRATQLDSLRQLSTLYRSYAAEGDDPALRVLAERELPRVNARIVELRKF